ncbi:hypothetical protein Catovirus_1_530 [Catovirus CTV1]|uniref:Uncharacterized protein n=1 Tax=Catovirus CTV1 TaxID=1977631 RepID=A0A1V0S9U2_9VIRU|nr:hypothetical protein Catovirus_1_530 [Catovirus CTV1]
MYNSIETLNNISQQIEEINLARQVGKNEFNKKVEEYKKNNNGRIDISTYYLMYNEYLNKYILNVDHDSITNKINLVAQKELEETNKKKKQLDELKNDCFRCLLIMVDLHPDNIPSYVDSYTTNIDNNERIVMLVKGKSGNYSEIRDNEYYIGEKMCVDANNNLTNYREFYFRIPDEYLADFECIKNGVLCNVSDKYKDLMKLKLGKYFLKYFLMVGSQMH